MEEEMFYEIPQGWEMSFDEFVNLHHQQEIEEQQCAEADKIVFHLWDGSTRVKYFSTKPNPNKIASLFA